MSTLCYFTPERVELELTSLTGDQFARFILPHYGNTTKDSTPFRCAGNGAPLYLQKRCGNHYLIHYGGTSCGSGFHRVTAPMTDEHRRQQEYIVRAAESNGLSADLEVDSGNGTRLDVSIVGDIRQGCEVQHSSLSVPAAKSRTTKSVRGGFEVVTWFSDSEVTPKWAQFVPTLESTVRGAWSFMPAPNEANVKIAIHNPGSDTPRAVESRTLDETIALIDSGEVLPIRIPGVRSSKRAYIDMVFRSSAERMAEAHGAHKVAWHPLAISERRPSEPTSSACRAQHETFFCRDCGKSLVQLDSLRRGHCRGCYERATATAEVMA